MVLEITDPQKIDKPVTFDPSTARREPAAGKTFDPSTARREEMTAGSLVTDTAEQFIGGLQDVTQFLSHPLRAAFGEVRISADGIQALSPEEAIEQVDETRIHESDNIFGSAARFAGQTLAVSPILGRLFGLVKAGKPLADGATRMQKLKAAPRNIAANAGATFARNPLTTTAVETAIGASAGAGGFIAKELNPDSDASEFVGEVLGATAPSLMPSRIAVKAAGGLRNIYTKVRAPTTEVGGKARAEGRAMRAATPEQREQALKELDLETTLDPVTGEPVLSLSERTATPGLLSLERAVVESSEKLLREADIRVAHANEVIQQSLQDVAADTTSLPDLPSPNGSGLQSISDITAAHKYLADLLDTNIQIAAQRVDEVMSALGPKTTREQLNRVAREELDSVLAAAKAQEDELFALVDPNAVVPFQNSLSTLTKFQKELAKAQQKHIAPVAKIIETLTGKPGVKIRGVEKVVVPPKTTTTVRELRGVQSELREFARNARSGDKKNLNAARVADAIADSIIDDFAAAKDGPEVADAIETAVTFSRNMRERLGRGAVGKILGRKSTGAPNVPAGLTLEESIGITGPKAREGFDDLLKAFDSPEAPSSATLINASEDFLRTKFIEAAVRGGRLNTTSAEAFIRNNAELLNRLPKLRSQIDEVLLTENALAVTQRQRGRVMLDDPRVSKAAMLIEKGPVDTFRRMTRDLKPAKAGTEMQKLVNRAARDQTGEAMQGLKSGFMEFLLSGARGGARDVNGLPFVSGFALRDAINNPTTRAMVTRLFSEAEQNRIGVITRDLIRMEQRRAAPISTEGVIGDTPSKVVETIAGITGAAAGRQSAKRFGAGGTVQIPGIMADRFRALVAAGVKDPAGRLIRDAIYDEELFRELLQASLTKDGLELSPPAVQRLNTWAFNVMAEYGGAFDESDE